ncbi:MAG: hypothetical protein ACFHVJ_17100 [Aestuariibacter sp.]
MLRLSRMRPLALATQQAIVMACIGLLVAVFYAFGGVIYDWYTTGGLNMGTALAFLALLGMPVMFAVVGFGIGLLITPLYNFFVRWQFD